jgi:ATP-dependent DNA helicase RecG
MNLEDLQQLISGGESETLELKRSTGELRAGLQTVCAFLNGVGGHVLFGVDGKGAVIGQELSDQTLRELAQALAGFEPHAPVRSVRVRIKAPREVMVLEVPGRTDGVPYTFEGRAYERVESTTRKMSRERYEQLLLDRAHSSRRWENQPAEQITIRDIDRDEVLRIAELARTAGRLLGPLERDHGRLLERFGLRSDGRILRGAVVLFGKKFVPDFPQCELRMARFRGTDKEEFLDQRIIRGPAFRLLEEAELFCLRHFPLPGKIVPERMERVDRPLIPPDALREILVNALIHRDYAIAGGAISLAIFDDRVEIWSAGTLPTGITIASLKKTHPSVPRNPLIAEVFNRAGLIEKWGRGINRVMQMCREHGIRPLEFEELAGSVVATFRVKVGDTGKRPTTQDTVQVTDQVTVQVTEQVRSILSAALEPRTSNELQQAAGLRHRAHFQATILKPLLARGWLEMTIPERPNSRNQRYRTTEDGKVALAAQRENGSQ